MCFTIEMMNQSFVIESVIQIGSPILDEFFKMEYQAFTTLTKRFSVCFSQSRLVSRRRCHDCIDLSEILVTGAFECESTMNRHNEN